MASTLQFGYKSGYNGMRNKGILKNSATLPGAVVLFLNMIIKEKTAPPSKRAPFSETAP